MRPTVADLRTSGVALVPVGGQIAGPFATLPVVPGMVFDWADGGLIDLSTYGAFFAAQGGAAHVYNGGVEPGSNKVRKPDKRGRAMVGADNYGQGDAKRIPNSNRALGQNGGEERHTLAPGEAAGGSFVNSAGVFFMSVQQSAAAPVYNFTVVTAAAHNNLQPYEVDAVLVRIA